VKKNLNSKKKVIVKRRILMKKELFKSRLTFRSFKGIGCKLKVLPSKNLGQVRNFLEKGLISFPNCFPQKIFGLLGIVFWRNFFREILGEKIGLLENCKRGGPQLFKRPPLLSVAPIDESINI